MEPLNALGEEQRPVREKLSTGGVQQVGQTEEIRQIGRVDNVKLVGQVSVTKGQCIARMEVELRLFIRVRKTGSL